MIDFEGILGVVGYLNAQDVPVMILNDNSRIVFTTHVVCQTLKARHKDVIGAHVSKFIAEGQVHPHEDKLSSPGEPEVKKYQKEGVVSARDSKGQTVLVRISQREKFTVAGTPYFSALVEPVSSK